MADDLQEPVAEPKSESQLPNEPLTPEKKGSKFPRWLIAIIVLIGICCVSVFIVVPMIFKVNVSGGGYSIESVTLSTGLENGQPVGITDVFKPSDTINCTVKTTGVKDGIIGMRWYFGDELIYDRAAKTQDNIVSMYIRSNKNAILPEGKYRVEIYMAGEALETVYFEVKVYHPIVSPSISIPEGHKSIETPWYPEVPFAFDEVWKVGNTEWKINEVKVLLMDETQEYFVEVVVNTDMKDISSLSEEKAKERTRDIALYAVKNGYIEKAMSLEIDGKQYDLNKFIFVTLINPSSHQVYRVKFTMDELK
ncbi:MAG: hypothetical protein KF758_17485 [Anaerolineales bacterium]|nr:hypothetical protein [Anaerolineales bacterium]